MSDDLLKDGAALRAVVKVGSVVELTDADRFQLWTATQVMYEASRTQGVGWLTTYVREYLRAGKILRAAMLRSHDVGAAH